MKVSADSVTVEVEFSHPTYLRILHHLNDDRDVDRDPAEWLKTLAWIQMQRDTGRFTVEAFGELPEDVKTNIKLYYQHQAQDPDKDADMYDMINEFVDIGFGELIDMNDLEPDGENETR